MPPKPKKKTCNIKTYKNKSRKILKDGVKIMKSIAQKVKALQAFVKIQQRKISKNIEKHGEVSKNVQAQCSESQKAEIDRIEDDEAELITEIQTLSLFISKFNNL